MNLLMHLLHSQDRNQSTSFFQNLTSTKTLIFDKLIVHLKDDIFSRFLNELLKSINKLCIIKLFIYIRKSKKS